ncbi:hypothetical protein [Metallibacterium scheffleri]
MKDEITPAASAATSIPKRRRRTGARVQVRLTTAEKTELAAAAHRAGYAHLARYLIDLHRGRVAPASPLDADAVRAAIRTEIEAVAERQVADLAALAESVERLREAVKNNYGPLAESIKVLAMRGSPGATARPAGSGSTTQPVGG